MKNIFLFSLVAILLTGCFMGTDPELNIKKITSDFWLLSSVTDNSYFIIESTEKEPTGGRVIVEENVVAVWHNKDFIIARRHPNYQQVVSDRLFGNCVKGGNYLLENPADTIYLSEEDSIYQKNGNWYHTSNGWNPPDSLNPYRAITYYHIIDLRKYKSNGHNGDYIYIFDNQDAFNAKKKELEIPDDIEYYL